MRTKFSAKPSDFKTAKTKMNRTWSKDPMHTYRHEDFIVRVYQKDDRFLHLICFSHANAWYKIDDLPF